LSPRPALPHNARMFDTNVAHSLIPVTVIGGFLGSGKTSLLNHILNNSHGTRFAVLVNDFGEVNIDAQLVVSVEGETISLANGCVCCVIRDDLLHAVIRLCSQDPAPDHIVVESSGVARPVSVAETFLNPVVQHLVELQNLITTLDADLVIDDQADYTDLAYTQIAVADIVVINKIDLVSPQQVETVRHKVESIVPRARIVETTFGAVPLELLFDSQVNAALAHRTNGNHASSSPGDEQRHEFETWTYRSGEAFSFGALQHAVEHLPRDIFRAKGLVRLDLDSGDYGILQLAGRRARLTLATPHSEAYQPVTTELVFIGKPGATTTERLDAHFDWARQQAASPESNGQVVTDLRALTVVFA
jgi:G3E family GTPase